MTTTDLIFPAFSRFFKFSFNEERRSSQVWQWRDFFSTNHNSLLRIAANEIASFCIDHRSRQMAFFRAKAGQKTGFRVMLKYFEIKKAFRYYIKQIDFMLPCVWFSNRSQKTSKCGKNISDTLGCASCAIFFVLTTFWRHLWSITEQTHGNMESICLLVIWGLWLAGIV